MGFDVLPGGSAVLLERAVAELALGEAARGALADAGIDKGNVDAYFTAGMPRYEHGLTPLIMTDYLDLDVSYAGTTDYGGSSYVSYVGHTVSAIRDGKCDVALVTLAGRPRSEPQNIGEPKLRTMQDSFETIYGATILSKYAVAARRHIHEFGTTSEQLAEIRVAWVRRGGTLDGRRHGSPVGRGRCALFGGRPGVPTRRNGVAIALNQGSVNSMAPP